MCGQTILWFVIQKVTTPRSALFYVIWITLFLNFVYGLPYQMDAAHATCILFERNNIFWTDWIYLHLLRKWPWTSVHHEGHWTNWMSMWITTTTKTNQPMFTLSINIRDKYDNDTEAECNILLTKAWMMRLVALDLQKINNTNAPVQEIAFQLTYFHCSAC